MRPRFAPLRALVPLAILLVLAPDAGAFEVLRHSSMTDDIMTAEGITGNALSLIKQGVRKPDLDGCFESCYCPQQFVFCDPGPGVVLGLSAAHFDNNQLFEGRAWVEAYMQKARDTLARYTASPPASSQQRASLGKAWINFGIALHAIQDFYAHSTWVEDSEPFIRSAGRFDQIALWNGEDNWGAGSVVVAGVTVSGVQTGYERLAVPAGSVSHNQLNKDKPSSTQGQRTMTRIFPPGVIGTYYHIASGQFATGGPYTSAGLAPRHTMHAWGCLGAPGCPIYQLPPLANATSGSETPRLLDLNALVAWTNADAEIGQAAHFMDSVWTASNPDSPLTYPGALFDDEGWPLPPSTSVNDLVGPTSSPAMVLAPNPTAGLVSIRFRLPSHGPVRLEVFDAAGRRVATLLDEELYPGWKEVVWDGVRGAERALPAGSYLCRLTAAGKTSSGRVSLVR